MAILRHVIFGLLFLLPMLSHAETIPATQSGTAAKVYKYTSSFGTSGILRRDSAAEVCQALAPFVRVQYPNAVFANTYSGGCNYTYAPAAGAASVSGWSGGLICPEIQDGDSSNPATCAPVYTCPVDGGWTLSGTNCTRPDACLTSVVGTAQVWANAWAISTKVESASLIGPKTVPAVGCSNSCEIANESFTSCFPQGVPTVDAPAPIYCTLTGHQTGGTCTDNPVPPAAPVIPNHRPKCLPTEGVLTSSSGTVACVSSTTPSSVPVVRTEKQTQQFPDGSTRTTETTYTKDPVSQVQDTQQTITNTPATGGGTGIAGTPGTTSTSGSAQPSSGTDPDASDFCQKNGQLQICKGDMNLESTQKEVRDYIKSLTDAGSTPYTAIENAKQSTESDQELAAVQDELNKAADGRFEANTSEKSAWSNAMSDGWFSPIPSSTCSPYTATIGGHQWILDVCPTAEKIATISEYVIWFMLAVGVFVMLTGGLTGRST